MNLLRRIFVSFVMLFDILGFILIFVIMSNTSEQGNLIFMAKSDAVFISVIALVGIVVNIGLGYTLWRGSITRRRIDAERGPNQRSRITGE